MDENTLTAIALLGYFAVIVFVLWLTFHMHKPKPVPWDGVHRLQYVRYREVAEYPMDFHSGWVWKCTCGTGSTSVLRMAHAESEAFNEFKAHEGLYK